MFQNKIKSCLGKKGKKAIEHVKSFSKDSLLLKSADVISNVSEILEDYSKEGDSVFERFNALEPKKKSTIKNQLNVINTIIDYWKESPLVLELRRMINGLNIIIHDEGLTKNKDFLNSMDDGLRERINYEMWEITENADVDLIKRYKENIFEKLLSDKKSFHNYNFIQAEFKKGNVIKNKELQKVYKNFYRLNMAGLTDKFIEKYFDLLNRKEKNLKAILLELSKLPNRKGKYAVQLSFASKLIYTIDDNQPIYDSNLAKFFEIKEHFVVDLNKRINQRIEVYEKLKKKFYDVLEDDEISEIIKDFKIKFNQNISDVKMLDFMLWKLGGILSVGKKF